MKKSLFLFLLVAPAYIACTQTSTTNKPTPGTIGGPCEGCEAIYECPVPFDELEPMVWLPDWNEKESRIAINGVIYQPDGKTPAPNVIIYIYHTDQTGIYPKKGDENGWAKRHGYLRGWMKTNEKGEYKFFTRRPASYPGSREPAHIHVFIKEPDKNVYYIDEFLFDDDPYLTAERRKSLQQRGGSGILVFPEYYKDKASKKSERHIYLGKNIPGYPALRK